MEALAGPVIVVAALLALAGLLKLVRPVPTAGALRAMRLPSSVLAVRALGAAEVVLGLAAGITFSPPLLALTAAAYLAFAAFVVAALGSNVPLQSCGCFGQADTPPSAAHVVLDLAAAITVIAALVSDTPGLRATLADQPWHTAPVRAPPRDLRVPLRARADRPTADPCEAYERVSRWLVEKTSSVLAARTGRRGMLVRSAVVGSALAVNPVDFVFRPVSAFAAACTCRGQDCACGTACCDGYTEFCCTLNGRNTCPPGTVAAGWWRAEGSGLCGGSSRYYIDCNQRPDVAPCGCTCANGDCNNRVTCCVHFRYGQCHQELPQVGAIQCRVVTCSPPWTFDSTCTTVDAVDNATASHDAPCLHQASGIPGRLQTAQWFLRNTPTTGVADQHFTYGSPGDLPIVGDWDGDGVATPGVVRDGVFYLRNSNTSGKADIVFSYGNPGDRVIVGDWNGDGTDTIGIVRGTTFYLRNSNTSGVADIVFSYGDPGDRAIVGDWNGDGTDTIGIVPGGTFYLRNSQHLWRRRHHLLLRRPRRPRHRRRLGR